MTTLTKKEVITFVKNALKSKDVPKMRKAVALHEKWLKSPKAGNYLDKLPNDILDFIKTKIPLKKCNKITLFTDDDDDTDSLTFTFADKDEKFANREMGCNHYELKRTSMLWINYVIEKANWVDGEELFINIKCNCDNYFYAWFHKDTEVNFSDDFKIDTEGYISGRYFEPYKFGYVFVRLNCKYNDLNCVRLKTKKEGGR